MILNNGVTERLRALPKAELHLHIEGTLEPDMVFAISRRNGVPLPYRDPVDLASRFHFDDLQGFLDVYYQTMGVLQREEDFFDLTYAYLTRAHADGVRHAEVFFDPQAHLSRGVALSAQIGGLSSAFARASSEYGMTGGLVLCFLRDRPAREALATLEMVLSQHPRTIMGIGLDSAEVGYPPKLFEEVFDQARAARLHLCAHAGEEGPASYIWEALDVLGVERIDHGIRALEDEALMMRLAAEAVPLTVCPLSNVRLKACESLEAHPVLELLNRGVRVTINSDDPAFFGGYVADNYAALDLGEAQYAALARNSVAASFAPADRKQVLLAEVAAWERTPPSGSLH